MPQMQEAQPPRKTMNRTFVNPVDFDPIEISVLIYVHATAARGNAPLESATVKSTNQEKPPAKMCRRELPLSSEA